VARGIDNIRKSRGDSNVGLNFLRMREFEDAKKDHKTPLAIKVK